MNESRDSAPQAKWKPLLQSMVDELLSHLDEWVAMGRVALSDCHITMEDVSSGAARQGHGLRPGTVDGNAYDILIRFPRTNGIGLP